MEEAELTEGAGGAAILGAEGFSRGGEGRGDRRDDFGVRCAFFNGGADFFGCLGFAARPAGARAGRPDFRWGFLRWAMGERREGSQRRVS